MNSSGICTGLRKVCWIFLLTYIVIYIGFGIDAGFSALEIAFNASFFVGIWCLIQVLAVPFILVILITVLEEEGFIDNISSRIKRLQEQQKETDEKLEEINIKLREKD